MAKSLAIAYSMKKKKASGGTVKGGDPEINYAKGGEVNPMQEVMCPHCTKTFSHGGQVANDLGQGAGADELPNEFDDLVLDDDQEMKGYTGKNSGDEIGGPSKDDLVSKAMLKRKAKK